MAPDRRASGAARRRRSYETGVLRSHTMNIVPLVIYACAFVGYSLHFARRTAISARLATTMLAAATLAHTFIVGMQTMRGGQVPVLDATSATSMLVGPPASAYLYPQVSTAR